MLEVSNVQTYGWQAAIRGMRNPLNSWAKSDSGHELSYVDDNGEEVYNADFTLGSNDY